MISIIDGPKGKDDWGTINWDTNTISFEESDTVADLSTSHILFTTGKYVGSKLSEVSDTWYLKFIKEKNPQDYFISLMFGRRIRELE